MGSNTDLGNVIPRTLLTLSAWNLWKIPEGFVSGYHLENVMGKEKVGLVPESKSRDGKFHIDCPFLF